jgi:hypothetical protein
MSPFTHTHKTVKEPFAKLEILLLFKSQRRKKKKNSQDRIQVLPDVHNGKTCRMENSKPWPVRKSMSLKLLFKQAQYLRTSLGISKPSQKTGSEH